MKKKAKVLGIMFMAFLAIGLGSIQLFAQDAEGVKGRDIVFENKGLPYGFESALPEIHGFVSGQFWKADEMIQNQYANVKSAAKHYGAGESVFDLHSLYLDIISELTQDFLVESEFEIYHSGESVKAGAIRGLWHPDPKFNLSIGRQMVMLGSQERVYYPTAKYRFFTWQPILSEKFLRFTGWWDNGLQALGRIPLGDTDMFAEYGLMVSNGPGNADDETRLLGGSSNIGVMNTSGYVYEQFDNSLRQRTDNNDNKPVSWRLGFSPFKDLVFRVEGMEGKYDTNNDYDFNYLTSEIFFSRGRLDSMFGWGQLKYYYPADTYTGYMWPGGTVKQASYYIVGGYKVIEKQKGINFLQPVFRFEWIDPNMDAPSTVKQYEHYGERYAYNIGLNYSPWEHVCFRTGYRWQDERKGPELENDGFTMEAVFDF